MNSNYLTIASIVAFLLFLLGLIVAFQVAKGLRRSKGSRVRTRGKRAENNAASLLEDEGFRILKVEPVIRHKLRINGRAMNFDITPDFLVEKDDQRYVVEVKQLDGSIKNAPIRRQVLEYMAAANLPCLLVIMPQGYLDIIETEDHFKAHS